MVTLIECCCLTECCIHADPCADPNGLMWTRDSATGNVTYHMYFQSADPGQSIGSIWGHAHSPDLVHWDRLPRTGMRGSSGGGVSLPADFEPPTELTGARAIAISSVPMSPSLNPPTGLHLWYSTDEQLLNWTEYRNESSVQPSTNATCVICPADVPAAYSPGYIGDNYVWSERRHDGSYEFFVLSGSTRCADGHPWCSYQGIGGNATAQAFVFRSMDLLHWQLLSDWDFLPKQAAYPAGFPHSGKSQWPAERIDTPDTFPLIDPQTGTEEQVFVWLGSPGCNTHWMLGSLNNESKDFTPSSRIGCADRGAVLCQQSLTIPDGSRVSMGWVEATGDGWDGAQSLPRVVTLDRFGVAYAPLSGLYMLHQDYHFDHHLTMTAGNITELPGLSSFGASMHVAIELIPSSSSHSTADSPARLHMLHAGNVSHLKQSPSSNHTSVVLSLLGGACLVELAYVAPDSATCENGIIANNTDSTNVGVKAPVVAQNQSVGPEWCRSLCCAEPDCAAWTFTNPQPGTNGSTWDCWFKGLGSSLFSSACGDGHCYSGLSTPGSWLVTVGGVALGSVRASSMTTHPRFDAFVDGSIVEVFFAGEVVTQNFPKARSQNVSLMVKNASTRGGGDSVLLRLDAWRMDASVSGPPE